MLRVIAWAKAAAGCESELEDALRAMLQPTRSEQGCTVYELYRSVAGGEFCFYEEWASEDALNAHDRTAHMATLQQAVPVLLAAADARDTAGRRCSAAALMSLRLLP